MPISIIDRTIPHARALTLAALLTTSACSRVQLRSPIAPVAGPPASFVQSTSDVKSTRVIDVREGTTKAAAFKAASDALSQKFSVDVSDQTHGFLMTPWQATLMREGAPDLRYRVRIVIRFLGEDWKQATVRSEANWQRGNDEWDVGYDSKALDEVANDLRGRIGKTP